MFKKGGSMLLLWLSSWLLTMQVQAQVKTISFGQKGEIRYDLGTGKYDVWVDGRAIIQQAYGACRQVDLTIPTSYYQIRSCTETSLADALGKGTCYTITSTSNDSTKGGVQQLFYVYEGSNCFYTQLRAYGPNYTSLSPLITTSASIGASADSRVLKVPFDNDAWVRYDAAPLTAAKPLNAPDFTSAEVTAIYDNSSRQGLIIGSIDHTDWKSGIVVRGADSGKIAVLETRGGYTDPVYTHDHKSHGLVSPDKDGFVSSPRFMVGWFKDWRDGLEQYGLANQKAISRYLKPWTKGKPFGWNSWGVMQTQISLPKVKAVVDFFHDSCRGFCTSDHTLYIDLDSYWDMLVQNGDYSQLTAFCQYCKKRGFQPGVYWAPFVDWGKSPRQIEGSQYWYQDCWIKQKGQYNDLDGARAMDPTHPGTKARIAYLVGKFKACGFTMIKIDFLGHATLEADHFYDATVHTGMQAFRKGMEWLDDQLDNTMLVYAAISPNLATARYVHMRRIACDAFNRIDETAYTMNSVTYGWWQQKMYDYIDADHVVFKDGPLGANRARLLSAILTGTLITGDDYSVRGAWQTTAINLLQNKALLELARNSKAFRPVEGNTRTQAAHSFVGHVNGHYYLAILNYADTVLQEPLDPARIGLPASMKTLKLQELFSGQPLSPDSDITVPPADAVLLQIN